MLSLLPAPDCSTDEESCLQLARALHWEAAGRLPRGNWVVGVLVQAAVISPWFLQSLGMPVEDRRPAAYGVAVPIFALQTSRPAPTDRSMAPQPGQIQSPKLELPEGPVPELAVDLSAIELSFADDVGNQLPEVVRKYGGMLALFDREDWNVAQYVLKPPAWEPEKGTKDLSRTFRLSMNPPRKWAVFRAAAEKYGLALDQYQAFAVFDSAYPRCLKDAIRNSALSRAPASPERVSSARLAFAVDRPCGIEVLEVSHAANATHQP